MIPAAEPVGSRDPSAESRQAVQHERADHGHVQCGGYITFLKDGLPVAGCMRNDGQSGVPDVWSVLAADDAEATVAAAAAHGGQVIVPAMEVDRPSTYVVCEGDQAIPVFAQEAMSQRAQDVVRLDAGHSPFLSQPDALVRLLARFV